MALASLLVRSQATIHPSQVVIEESSGHRRAQRKNSDPENGDSAR